MHNFIRIVVLAAVFTGAALPAGAATPDDFYTSLLRRGIAAHDAGRYADATRQLRIAAFGLVESIDHYQTAQVYLAVTYDKLRETDRAREAARRVVAAQRIESRYSGLALPAGVRSAFDSASSQLLGSGDLALLRATSTSSTPSTVPSTQPQTQTATPPRTSASASQPATIPAQTPTRTAQTTTPPPSSSSSTQPGRTSDEPASQPSTPRQTTPAPQTTAPATQTPRPAQQQQPTTPPPVRTPPATTPANNTPTPKPPQTAPSSSTPSASTPRTTPQTVPSTPATTTNTKPATPPPAATTTKPTTPPPSARALTASEITSRIGAADRALGSANLNDARRLYREVLAVPTLEHETLVRVAEGLYRSRDFANSLTAFTRLGTLRKGEEPYRYYIAVAAYETGDYARAKKELAAALPYIEVTPDVARYRTKIEGAM